MRTRASVGALIKEILNAPKILSPLDLHIHPSINNNFIFIIISGRCGRTIRGHHLPSEEFPHCTLGTYCCFWGRRRLDDEGCIPQESGGPQLVGNEVGGPLGRREISHGTLDYSTRYRFLSGTSFFAFYLVPLVCHLCLFLGLNRHVWIKNSLSVRLIGFSNFWKECRRTDRIT